MGQALRQAVSVGTPRIPLIWAKLKPPVLRAEAIVRSELVAGLASSNAALTAIVAPAGYGKTTVAAQLIAELEGLVGWVSLEPGDSSPPRFWTYLAAALAGAGVAGAEDTFDVIAEDGVVAGEQVLRAAVEAATEPVTLVLDDLHYIDGEEIVGPLNDWLRHPIDGFRLVCTSRIDLPLPVGRLRGQGQLTEARIEQLAFTSAESARLLGGTFGLDALTGDQLATLDARTEGWPVGVYLAGLTLRDDPDIDSELRRFAGDTRHLTEYLTAEVMNTMSDDVRAFALATSIVTVLDPDLCDVLTGEPGSLRILRRLTNENVFTSALDPAATEFHYHPLFREHLRSALASEHPTQLTDLHDRASRWFEGRGELDEAVHHAVQAENLVRAEALIISSLERFSEAGHFDTVVRWIDALGEPTKLRTETVLVMAWTMLNLRRYEELEHWLEVAARVATSRREAAVAAVQIPTVRAHWARHRGDLPAMKAYSAEALTNRDAYPTQEEVSDIFQRSQSALGAAMSVAGTTAYWAGEMQRSIELVSEGLMIGRSAEIDLETIFCYGYLGLAELEVGDPETAMDHADQALAVVQGKERHLVPVVPYLVKSMAQLGLGRPREARESLARVDELAAIRSEPFVDILIACQHALLAHRTGDSETARLYAREAAATNASLPGDPLGDRIRSTEAAIRFVAKDIDALPIGARELTERERAVLNLLPYGLKRKEVAAQLHVSENTVKTHLTSIRHKLGVQGREPIVDRAVELGLLPED